MKVLMINPPLITTCVEQTENYPDSGVPFGLLLFSTLLKKNSRHEVKLLNCIHESYGQVTFYDEYRMGSDNRARKRVFLLGKTIREIESELHNYQNTYAPDLIMITCSISYNYPIVKDIISSCRKICPAARIVLGGTYTKTDYAHAQTLGADRIFNTRIKETGEIPDYSILGYIPQVIVFRLFLGCKNKCNFCANCLEDFQEYDEAFVVQYLKALEIKYAPRFFRNWDPNVLLSRERLIAFLRLSRTELHTDLAFDMGLQPNLLDDTLLEELMLSRVKMITLPFDLYSGHEKPNSVISSIKVLAKIAERRYFDPAKIHCTFIIGYPDEDLKKILIVFWAIKTLGGQPNCFPLTPITGTNDYNTYREILATKDLKEYNGNLWPLLPSSKINDYEQLYRLTYAHSSNEREEILKQSSHYLQTAFSKATTLSEKFIKLCLAHEDSKENIERIFDAILG